MSSTVFETEGFSSGRCTYWTVYTDARKITIPYHNCIYNRLPEEEPSVSKHVEDTKIKNWNINSENIYFFGLYCMIISKYMTRGFREIYYLVQNRDPLQSVMNK
jgi:hypothetical protein